MERKNFDSIMVFIEGYYGEDYPDKMKTSLWGTVKNWKQAEFGRCVRWLEDHYEPTVRKKVPTPRDFKKWYSGMLRELEGDDQFLNPHKARNLISRVKSGQLTVSKEYLTHLENIADTPTEDPLLPANLSKRYMDLVCLAMTELKGNTKLPYSRWAEAFNKVWEGVQNDQGCEAAINAAETLLNQAIGKPDVNLEVA